MNNHFIIPYSGNKRAEVNVILKYIEKTVDMNTIETIIEPFCGSSAVSYYISTLYPGRFKYVLNDIDVNLIELYNIMRDPVKLRAFFDEVNRLCFDANDTFVSKEEHKKIKEQKTVYSWFIERYYYQRFKGLYPTTDGKPKKIDIEKKLNEIPILKFLKNENVVILNKDALDVIKDYNSVNNVLLLDPPYVGCDNSFYTNKSNMNIYEWLLEKGESKLYNCYVVLEYNWMVKLLFKTIPKWCYAKSYYSNLKRESTNVIGLYSKTYKPQLIRLKKNINISNSQEI